MNPLPTVSQIREVERLLATDLFDLPTIARLSGVRFGDVCRIAAHSPIDVGPDGVVADGQHRLLAASKNQTSNIITQKGTLSMSPKHHNTITKKERDELVDFGIEIGQVCWQVYCRTKTGYFRLFKLANNADRRRANELFHLGFSARLFMCPPSVYPADDAVTETRLGKKMWKDYLSTMDGRVVLGNVIYPDTPKAVLDNAREFFLEGFRAGTIAVNEIFKM